jgi:lipopolysaccharide/colanic/teichoic acid biosynthesis glycosyltransferase
MVYRVLDVILSSAALVLLAPLLLPVGLLLRFTGEGEVLFRQERVGKDGRLFDLYKFATMLKNSPKMGTGTITLRNDYRVLPVGKVLRQTKINELPQLLNVLWGDMSLVGPRPQTPRCFMAFPSELQSIISQVKPGLSGIGPIVFRKEEDILANRDASVDFYDRVIAPYKAQLESWYVHQQTLANYLAVILVTLWVVLRPSSDVVWRAFRDLPVPPDSLKDHLNYPVGSA